MKASAKHFRAHAPHAHETQTKLKVFRSSALALNQIGNLEIPFNSLKLIFLDVNARYWLRIFVNSTVVTCVINERRCCLNLKALITKSLTNMAANYNLRIAGSCI